MDQWEYFTTFLEANIEIAPVPVRDDIPLREHPVYSPYSLIPQLNLYGARGWELVSMEPVIPGKKHDVVQADASAMKWGRHYLCAFKRRIPA